jgi:hypothetical protein
MREYTPKEKAKIAKSLNLCGSRCATILQLVLIACSGRQMLHRKGALGQDSFGSIGLFRPWFGHFRSTPRNGHRQTAPACLKRANSDIAAAINSKEKPPKGGSQIQTRDARGIRRPSILALTSDDTLCKIAAQRGANMMSVSITAVAHHRLSRRRTHFANLKISNAHSCVQ